MQLLPSLSWIPPQFVLGCCLVLSFPGPVLSSFRLYLVVLTGWLSSAHSWTCCRGQFGCSAGGLCSFWGMCYIKLLDSAKKFRWVLSAIDKDGGKWPREWPLSRNLHTAIIMIYSDIYFDTQYNTLQQWSMAQLQLQPSQGFLNKTISISRRFYPFPLFSIHF